MLSVTDFVEQFVERLRRESLACGQRPQHVYQEQANPKNLRERWIVGRVSAQLPEDYIPHPFAPRHAFCSRDLIEELRADKRTILMTTHYIEEAERLCDRVAIIDAGKIVALGSPRELQEKSMEQSGIEIRLTQPMRERALPNLAGAISTTISEDGREIQARSAKPARTLVELVKWVDGQGYEIEDVHLHRHTLEDVFIEMTGKKLRE